MSTNLPTKEPQQITAGDTVQWLRAVDNYPASSGWTLSYVFRGPQTIKQNATTYANSADYIVTMSPANTANYKAGLYSIEAYVSDGTNRYSVATWFPQITVKANPAAYVDGSADNRSFAARTLAACETAIYSLSSRKVQSASVNGQTYSIQSLASLIALRNRMREEVQSEQDAINVAAGLGSKKNVYVRFPPMYNAGWPYVPGYPPQSY